VIFLEWWVAMHLHRPKSKSVSGQLSSVIKTSWLALLLFGSLGWPSCPCVLRGHIHVCCAVWCTTACLVNDTRPRASLSTTRSDWARAVLQLHLRCVNIPKVFIASQFNTHKQFAQPISTFQHSNIPTFQHSNIPTWFSCVF
jgi:hypothetical protein